MAKRQPLEAGAETWRPQLGDVVKATDGREFTVFGFARSVPDQPIHVPAFREAIDPHRSKGFVFYAVDEVAPLTGVAEESLLGPIPDVRGTLRTAAVALVWGC